MGAHQTIHGGSLYDGYVARFSDCVRPTISFNVTSPICMGDSTGIATATIVSAAPLYLQYWNTMEDSVTVDSLVSGWYNFTYIDTNGCYRTEEVFIDQPGSIDPHITLTPVNCFGENNGVLSSFPTSEGGNIFDINWSTGDTTNTIDSLFAGEYYLTIVDSTNCTFEDTIMLGEPAILDVDFVSQSPLCNGDSNGIVSALVSGGIIPYYINWSTSDSTFIIDSLIVGQYFAYVTDSHGCVITDSIVVIEPTLIALTLTSSPDDGGCTGTASAFVSGGIPPYSFLWSNADVDTSAVNLCSGWISFTVVDSNGCNIQDSVFVLSTSNVQNMSNQVLNIFPNPSSGIVNIVTPAEDSYILRLFDNLNRVVLKRSFCQGACSFDISELESGIYVIELTFGGYKRISRLLVKI
jgi:hypothetical protein